MVVADTQAGHEHLSPDLAHRGAVSEHYGATAGLKGREQQL
jgi:hypothetical protein